MDNYSRNLKPQMQDLKIVPRTLLKQLELALYLTDKKFWQSLKSYPEKKENKTTCFHLVWLKDGHF